MCTCCICICISRPATSTRTKDDVATEATWISSTRLSCPTPPAAALGLDLTDTATSGRVALRVSANGHDVSEAHVIYFTYYLAPTVTGLTPQLGPASGGTAITITGDHLGTGSVVSRWRKKGILSKPKRAEYSTFTSSPF